MPRVAALYRYPVKGFTPEECETLTVLDNGRIAGDRVLGIRFADTAAADDAWSKKTEMLALMNTPGLARLHLKFEAEALRLRLSFTRSIERILHRRHRRRHAIGMHNGCTLTIPSKSKQWAAVKTTSWPMTVPVHSAP